MQAETAIAIKSSELPALENWAVISDDFQNQCEVAISAESLLGSVKNEDTNNRAQRARVTLKALKGQLERERKRLKEPLLELGRKLDRAVALIQDRLDHEDGRLEQLQKTFLLEEQRRVREEERKQREEQERIERERRAEIQRIENERLESERKAREAREAADRAEREAKNKKQREEAERLRLEAEAKSAEAARQTKVAEQQTALVNENADLNLRAESAPISVTRAAGQVNKRVWKIKSINDFQLVKARPDLVRKFEWDKLAITEALNAGQKLPGVEAEEDFSIGARGRGSVTVNV